MIPPDNAQTKIIIAAQICDECNALKISKKDYRREFIKRAVDRLKLSEEEAAQTFTAIVSITATLKSETA